MRSGGRLAAIQLWATSELRRRWLGLVLLGVLAGVAAGLAIAAVDGAERAGSAFERVHTNQLGADAVFFPSQAYVDDADVSKLDQLPEVAAVGGFGLTQSSIDEVPDGGAFVLIGPDWFAGIERAAVLEGRLPDPQRDDEAVVNAQARAEGFGVGAELTWRNLSRAQVEGFPNQSAPTDFDWSKAATTTKLHIVGVVRLPMESVASFASGPMLYVGPGWAAAHAEDAATSFTNAVVRLRHGAADLPAFRDGVASVYGRSDLPVKDLSDDIKRVQRALDLERTALLLFAGAVVIAAMVLVGQAFLRSVRAGADDIPALRSMGLDQRALVAGLFSPHLLTVVTSGVVAAAAAIALSTRFPIGLARDIEPAGGVHVDGALFAVGIVATVLVTTLGGLLIAWVTVRRSTAGRRAGRTHIVGAATRMGAPVPAAVGASLALDRPPSRAGGTARPALVAAVVGVFGIVGAFTLVGAIDDVVDRPERVGQSWDLVAYWRDAGIDRDEAESLPLADDDVAGAASATRYAASGVNGQDTPLYSIRVLREGVGFSPLSGRAPSADDEVALGPRTASVVGASIGDTVTVGPASRPMRVVGITLLAQTPHTSFDEGAQVTPAALDEMVAPDDILRDEELLLAVRHGASVDAVAEALTAAGLPVELPSPPPDVSNLRTVRSLPLYLAGFLVLLAVGAVAHALLTSAKSRARELAVLRAIGLTPRQAAWCVTWQAAVIGIVAIVIGLPLGVVLGREIWRRMADSLSFVYVGPFAPIVLATVIPVSLALVALLAVWPARRAARLRTAEVLRTE